MRSLTKEMFATELEAMVAEMPLGKVRVTELCRRCGVSPQAFYYHFKDKYDLVAWIFMHDLEVSGKEGTYEHVMAGFKRLWERRAFYAKVIDQRTQNSLIEYIPQYFASRARNELSTDQVLANWFCACGGAAVLSMWLRGRIEATPEDVAEFVMSQVAPIILRVIPREGQQRQQSGSPDTQSTVWHVRSAIGTEQPDGLPTTDSPDRSEVAPFDHSGPNPCVT